jgi:hypothetical protein
MLINFGTAVWIIAGGSLSGRNRLIAVPISFVVPF